MKKWQYLIRTLYKDRDTGEEFWNDNSKLDLYDRLHELGEDGWELAAVYSEDGGRIYIWKRFYTGYRPRTPDDDEK